MNFRERCVLGLSIVGRAALDNPASGVAAVLGAFSVGLIMQASQPINHDTGWLLVATNRLLDGASIYVRDLIEVNPPLILYLFTPSVALSRIFELPEIRTFQVYVVLVELGMLLLCHVALRVMFDGRHGVIRLYLLAALTGCFMIFPEIEVGQREHFMLMLLLPYLILVAHRCRDGDVSPKLAVGIGILGGIAIGMKPHYVITLIALEILLVLRRGALRKWMRPELLSLIVVGGVYLVSVFVFTPGYFEVVVPLVMDAYWVYQKPLTDLVETRDVVFLALGWGLTLWVRGDEDLADLALTLCTAATAFYLAMLIQGIGWPYHHIPHRAALGLDLCVVTIAMLRRVPLLRVRTSNALRSAGVGAVAVVVTLSLLALPYVSMTLRNGAAWRQGRSVGMIGQFVKTIDREAKGGSVYFLTPRLLAPFPAVNYAGARWTSRFYGLWFVMAVVRGRAGDADVPASLTAERLNALETYLRDAVFEDLRDGEPDLIFVDTYKNHYAQGDHSVDLLSFFQQDTRFREIFSGYRKVGMMTFGGFHVYKRKARSQVIQRESL